MLSLVDKATRNTNCHPRTSGDPLNADGRNRNGFALGSKVLAASLMQVLQARRLLDPPWRGDDKARVVRTAAEQAAREAMPTDMTRAFGGVAE